MAVIFPQNPTPGQVYLPQGSSIGYTWTGTFWDKGVVAFVPTGSLELVVSYVPGTAVNGPVASAQTASYVSGGEFFSTISDTAVLGTAVSLDNLRARISSAGSCSIQLRAVSGTMLIDGMDPGGVGEINQVTRIEGVTLNSAYKYVNAHKNLVNPGDSQIFTFVDRSTGASYRVTGLVGYNYEKNLICIEKLV